MASDMDRRHFLGSVSIAVGRVAMGSWLPATLLQAAPAACLVNAADFHDACGDWQLDDICMAYPPYSLHMQSGTPAVTMPGAIIDPVDSHWVA